ncbi:tumor suppressor, Mitostatin-domain-containing protein [Pelagophyceae sp. CCMP2097]|nr:tumor suppressor, Mitostatin-domain-containing protein [Pelagophyceae sp. CCMP2097]|mmetsp:Transcript_13364/g.46500  ORF Transcript_13364/g.46500 Transcript_13364/m.46500 type:complete len:470 (+) Transcript_13364:119-1528(+)
MASMQRRVNSSSIDATMATRRQQEDVTKGLCNYVQDNTKLQIAALSENTLPQRRRMNNSLKLENERRIKQLEEERSISQYAQDYDEKQSAALASVLERRQADRERQEREVRRICDESEELKDLELKLKFAYMNKERAAQHEEKILGERRTEQRERAMDEQMEWDRRAAEDAEADKAARSKDVLFRQKAALQAQMLERESLKAEALQEAERDRALVDVVVRQIYAEDEAELRERGKRRLETQAAIRDYEEQRHRDVEEAKAQARRDEAEIQSHANALQARERSMQQAKAEKKARDAANFAKIVAETERAAAESGELDALRDLLWAEEMEASRRREEENRAAKRAKSKAEMALANLDMLQKKAEQRRDAAAEEDRLVGIMRAKFAEDEARERAIQQQKRVATNQYIAAVSTQKQERHAMYEAAKQVELDAEAEEARLAEYKLRVIREARRRLLEEHAQDLRGFLPKGVHLN